MRSLIKRVPKWNSFCICSYLFFKIDDVYGIVVKIGKMGKNRFLIFPVYLKIYNNLEEKT